MQGAKHLFSPFAKFARLQASGGVMLLIFVVIALLAANIPALRWLHDFWETDLKLSFNYNLQYLPLRTVGEWINKALMVIFFLSFGLEIKREMMVGGLAKRSNAMLSIFAAIGGAMVPAIIYFCFNSQSVIEGSNFGFGIPMATGVALTMCVFAALGARVPIALKVFLVAIAIMDDLLAVILMAVLYPTQTIYFELLIACAGVIFILILLNRYRVNNTFVYVFLGFLLWFFMLRSGMHPALAGIALAMTIPSSIKINQIRFYVRSKYMIERFRSAYNNASLLENSQEQEQINNLAREISNATPLILRLENSIQPWINYCILPLFALSNMGVVIDSETINQLTSLEPISDFYNIAYIRIFLGVVVGLVVGKPLGITLMSFIAVKLKIASLPDKSTWGQLIAVSVLAGLGFTMSMFVSTIAFGADNEAALQNVGKLAALVASIVAGTLGYLLLRLTTHKPAENRVTKSDAEKHAGVFL
ncbi:MAG: Na+/H+ antiporter NhaA [Prevotellaceae bacterium]|jgi:NhaA family Na+:H+ antiporter|nr:Na+/H+ antiporter NhaA [Prevotellaceae bacterium]